MSSYYTFRFTFREAPETEDSLKKYMVNMMYVFNLDMSANFTIGYHTYNSYGDDTHPHFHIHFESAQKIDALRKSFQRFAKDDVECLGRKGVALYSLKLSKEEHIQNIDRFFRYPFKMVHKCNTYFNNYFEDEEPQIEMATTEYEETKARLTEKRKKDEEKSSTYDKWLETIPQPLGTKKEVQKSLIRFYIENKMAMNPRTMQGYTYTYCMTHKLMTEDQFIELMDK